MYFLPCEYADHCTSNLVTVRDSVELAYEAFGSDEDPLVLLISGAGAPARFWPDSFCLDLATHRRFVVRYSHRDTGISTHFAEVYPIDELLHDLLALIELLDKPTCHVVGHSMGGFLAQMAMCEIPKKVDSVTSISAGSTVTPAVAAKLKMTSATESTWEKLMKNQPTGDFEKDLEGWLESWRFINGARLFDEQLAIQYTRELYSGDPRNAQVAVNHIHAMSTVPSTLVTAITKVNCPLLVLHGTVDPLVPIDNGKATARLVPNAKLTQLEGAGHMFFNGKAWCEIGREVLSHTNVAADQL